MITGLVSNHRAFVSLNVRGPNGAGGDVEFVLDTGFTGAVTMPTAACAALGLSIDRLQPSRLADGTRVMLDVYIGTLLWDGEEREVEVLGMEGAPLLGMTLLDGSDVHLQVTEGGLVSIEPL